MGSRLRAEIWDVGVSEPFFWKLVLQRVNIGERPSRKRRLWTVSTLVLKFRYELEQGGRRWLGRRSKPSQRWLAAAGKFPWGSAFPHREVFPAYLYSNSCPNPRRRWGLTQWGRCGNLPNGCLIRDAGSRDARSGAGVIGRVAFCSLEAVRAESARADVGGSCNCGVCEAGRACLTGTAVACLADSAGDPAHP